ncbi:MAG: transglutaminase family protein [Planctomycetota bacterium]|jgi:hypothetical protein
MHSLTRHGAGRFRVLAGAVLLSLLASAAPAPRGTAAETIAPPAPKTRAEAIAAVKRLAAGDESALTYLGVVIAASRVLQPDLDAARIEKQVDEIAAKVKAAAAGAETAEEKIAAMNKVIYGQSGFRTDIVAGSSPTSGQGALDASMLHRVLERKQGVCLGLTTVYVVVAERAGLPIYPVHAPCHIFCRYEDGMGTLLEEQVNVECTAGGIARSDRAIARKVRATRAAMRSKTYFRLATRKEMLADQINNLAYDLAARREGPAPLNWALVHYKAGHPVKALALCDQAISLCREFGAPAVVMPFYRRRRAELERAVQAARKKKAPQPE